MDPNSPVVEFATKAEVDADAAERVVTFHGFASLVFWFGIHALVDVLGIIFLLTGQIALGLVCIFAGIAILVSAIVRVVNRGRKPSQSVAPKRIADKPTAFPQGAERPPASAHA